MKEQKLLLHHQSWNNDTDDVKKKKQLCVCVCVPVKYGFGLFDKMYYILVVGSAYQGLNTMQYWIAVVRVRANIQNYN